MKYRQNLYTILFCVFGLIELKANDASFYVSGNQLIPITENRISVKREILQIKRKGEEFQIHVYYEFFNPDEKRIVEVGFEAESPYGGGEGTLPEKGRHPFISDFTVNMNAVNLPYQVAIVEDSVYFANGIYKTVPESRYQTEENYEIFNYRYVYHFKAQFKKGLNKLIHTYSFRASSSFENPYSLNYILTAACRWANKQIDDFTLIIDPGEMESVNINRSFFQSGSEWILLGKGRTQDIDSMDYNGSYTAFHLQNGTIWFEKKNFKPKKELNLFSFHIYCLNNYEFTDTFNAKLHVLPLSRQYDPSIASDSFSLRILRNLPYARRGYLFKSAELQKWFERMPWYLPDPSFMADLGSLNKDEKEWLKRIRI